MVFAKITDSRIWKTNVYDVIYFNDFTKSNLVNNILKRFIMNYMSVVVGHLRGLIEFELLTIAMI